MNTLRVSRRPVTGCRVSALYNTRSRNATSSHARYAYSSLTSALINGPRVVETLHKTCKWGADHVYGSKATETGMCRLSLTDADKQVRDWFVSEARTLKCDVTVDQLGNIFAVRPGKSDGLPTFMGSHLDTQPTGGRYDGILGVVAGLEALRALEESGTQTQYPVGVVDWTNEEGARFPKSMMASGVWAGDIPLVDAWSLKEVSGKGRTVGEELERIGYLGKHKCTWDPKNGGVGMAAHFELHIEQGPILESLGGRNIGVVQGSFAYNWYTLHVTGAECHTGTTPMESRADALLAASRMIIASNEIAKAHGGRASTGILTLEPGSTNTIPGSVTFSLDIRHSSDEVLAKMEEACLRQFEEIAKSEPKPCGFEWQRDTSSPAAVFDKTCVSAIQAAAEDVVGKEKTIAIVSGAGHDSVMTSRRGIPTGMIFVPCLAGISHNPREYCAPGDIELGAQVLLNAVQRFDAARKT